MDLRRPEDTPDCPLLEIEERHLRAWMGKHRIPDGLRPLLAAVLLYGRGASNPNGFNHWPPVLLKGMERRLCYAAEELYLAVMGAPGHTCPGCGAPVRLHASDEGTCSYEPLGLPANPDVARCSLCGARKEADDTEDVEAIDGWSREE